MSTNNKRTPTFKLTAIALELEALRKRAGGAKEEIEAGSKFWVALEDEKAGTVNGKTRKANMGTLCEWLNTDYHTQEKKEATTNICNDLYTLSIIALSTRNQVSSDICSVKLIMTVQEQSEHKLAFLGAQDLLYFHPSGGHMGIFIYKISCISTFKISEYFCKIWFNFVKSLPFFLNALVRWLARQRTDARFCQDCQGTM